ncbi:FlgD immunoglobulin-like domain containing protein [Streptomyces sp. NPDC004788]
MLRHTLTRGAFAAATVIALTVGSGLTPLAGTATAEEPVPGEVVVPAAPKRYPVSAWPYLTAQSSYYRADAAGTEGVFHYQGADRQVFWTRYADGRSTPVSLPAETGTTILGTGADTLAFLREGEVELRHADGTSRLLKVPEGLKAYAVFDSTVTAYERVLQPDGTYTAGPWHLLSLRPDGTVRDLPLTGPDNTFVGGSLAGDRSGILTATRVQDETRRYGIASTETGHVDTLTTPVPKTFVRAKLSPDHIALYSADTSNHTVLVGSRSDLSAPLTEVTIDNYQANGTSNHEFAIVGDWLVYVSSRNSLDAKPIAGGAAVTLLPRVSYGVSAGPDGTAAVVGGSDPVDWGVRRVTADASGKPVVTMVKPLPNPARIQGIALAQGRLSVVDDSDSSAYEYVRDISLSGTPAYGSRTKLTGTPFAPCATNDHACAAYHAMGDGRHIRLAQHDDTTDWFRLDGPGKYDLRDIHLPKGGEITDVSAEYLIHTVPGANGTPGVQSVVDADDRVLEQRTPTAAALWTSWLWTPGTTRGVVTAKDLATGKAVDSVDTGAPCVPEELQADGRWLYWSCGAEGPSGVYDRTAKTSRSVPAGEALLGDGYVVTHDKAAGTLVLTGADSAHPVSRVVGSLPDTGVSQRHTRWTVDRFGGHVAYADAEERVHVVPTGIAAQPLSVLTRTAVDTLEAGDSVPTRLLRLRFSKPAGPWTLTVRHAKTGEVSEIAAGADLRGQLEFFWSGRDTAGNLLPSGQYTWTLSAPPADGVGPVLQQSGDVVLSNGLSPASTRFMSASGERVMDTRAGTGVRKGKIGAGGTVTLQVAGHGGVPATGVSSVVLNVTATNATANTYITAYPYGTTRPTASSLNLAAGKTVPNLVTVPVKDGKVTFYNHAGTVDLIADVAGSYTSGPGVLLEPVRPSRILDTRSGLGVRKGPVRDSEAVWLKVAGRGGVPTTGVAAVVLNVTATNPTSGTYVTLYDSGWPRGSNLNTAAGETVSNLVVVPVYEGGVYLYNRNGQVDLVADVAGYFRSGLGSLFEPLAPSRAMDTRYGTGVRQGKIGAGQTVTLQVAGRNGVPSTGVTAVAMNVTATNATAGTYVTAYPYGTTRPTASNLNLPAGKTVAGQVIVPVKDGKVTFYNHGGTIDLIADVAGFYAE